MKNAIHIMYNDRNGKFKQTVKECSFKEAEKWLESIGAKYWEIG